jgi:chemotaxis protein methyltransferase CheR
MSRPALEQFAGLIREVTGNVVPEERFALLTELAERRARALSYRDVPAYVTALADGRLDGEWEGVISVVTIKESYFFRAPQQFEALRREILPRLIGAKAANPANPAKAAKAANTARGEGRTLRIWSAACARGEEPGTLAILLAEEPALAGWRWRILATDVDEEALKGARRGLYGERAVSQVPPDLLARYFTRRGKLYELDPALRASIEYQTLNLAQAPYGLPEDELDLILLRNVLIYFSRPLQVWVMGRVAARLAREGYLLLGASETLWQIQDELEPVDLGGSFAYRHPPADRPERPASLRAKSALTPMPPMSPMPAVPAAPAVPPKSAKPPKRKPIVGLPPSSRPVPVPRPAASPVFPVSLPAVDRLATAALLLADNRIAEAWSLAEELLAADPSEPATHALLAFLHDLSGRAEEAVTAYRAALYLDPALFQARLLLADCLLRLGHRDHAEKQFQEVLTLVTLNRERPLSALAALPFPDRERALRRCRQALQGV